MDVGLAGLCCKPTWSGSPQRVYIILIICILTTGQTMILNSWSPIVQIVENVLHWSDGTVALLELWFPAVLLVTAFPVAYLMETKGVRVIVLLGGTALFIGSGLRAIPITNDSSFTILNNVGTFVVAISAPIFPAICSAAAVTWFPADTRSVASSAVVGSAVLGGAIGFLLDTGVVSTTPATNIPLNIAHVNSSQNISSELNDINWRLKAHDEIFWLMFIQFLIIFVAWFPTIIYFPAKPDVAPSASALAERTEFRKALGTLIRMKSFWTLFGSFALLVGVVPAWLPVLGIAMRPINISSQLCAWIGVAATVSTVPFVLIESWIGQKYRCMKLVIMVSLLTSSIMFLIYALMCQQVFMSNTIVAFIVVVLGNATALGCVPSFFELTCECCYPVYEGLCTISIIFGTTIVSIIFYIPIIAVPNSPFEVGWVSWSPFVAVTGSLIVIAFLKETYNRLALDSGEGGKSSNEDETTHLLQEKPAAPIADSADDSVATQ